MGNSSSSTMKQMNSVFSENFTNISNEFANNNSQSCRIANVNKFRAGPNAKIKGCALVMENQAVMKCDLFSSVSSENSQDLKNIIEKAIDSTASSSNKAVTGFLSTAIANSNKSSTEIVSDIKNIVRNNIDTSSVTTCAQQAGIDQENVATIDGEWDCTSTEGKIKLSNKAQLEAAAKCVASQVGSILQSNQEISKIISKADQTLDSSSGGIADAISAVFSGLTGMYMIFFGAIILILFMFKDQIFGLLKMGMPGGMVTGMMGSMFNEDDNEGEKDE